MPASADPHHRPRPAPWAIILAFTLVYVSWGTTYLAIKEGVRNQDLPPALFGGTRVCLAGLLLLGFLRMRGRSIRLPWSELASVGLIGILLFVCGNGLITFAEKTVPSGVAAVLAATTPLWMAMLEMLWPRGERLSARGWLGLFVGLAGVLIVLSPKIDGQSSFRDWGLLLVIGSAFSWSVGALCLRHRRSHISHLTAAAYQMVIGGGGLTLIGLVLGEAGELTPEHFGAGAAFAFFYLLVVGSLVGFVAFNWLLGHVSAAQAGTYAYVNPMVAILVGWLIGNEEITGWIVGGMLVILVGVAIVRGATRRRHPVRPGAEPPITEGEELEGLPGSLPVEGTDGEDLQAPYRATIRPMT
jgi:drug/metabolite transporter (DMT)-like permease